MGTDFIPFSPPSFGPEEEVEIVDALRSGWVSTGPRTKAFERAFAEHLGVARAVAVNSGTAAMHVALAARGIGPGDEVIVPVITFPATANVVIHQGATPVFVDVRASDLNVDPERLIAAITPRTRAIIPVDMAGRPCDMDAIRTVAATHGLFVLSDSAHSIGATYRGRAVGTIADATAFSFYATKNLSTGEGGMLVTEDEELASRAAILSLHGISADAWKRYSPEGYSHWETVAAGFKYNMSDLAAALGIHQLRRLPGFLSRRRSIAAFYRERLSGLEGLDLLKDAPDTEPACHLFVCVARIEDLAVDRDWILAELHRVGIGVGVHFRALHLQPYYRARFGHAPGDLPVAEWASDRVFSIPLHPALTDAQVERIADAVRDTITKGRGRG